MIKEYIATERSRGVADEVIKEELLSKGWKIAEINRHLFGVSKAPHAPGFKISKLFSGRLAAHTFLVTFLANAMLVLLASLIPLAVYIILPLSIFLSLSLTIRRLHDFGRSGLLYLLYFIPVLNFIFFLYLLFKEGNKGVNKYGEQPDLKRDYLDLLFGR